MEKMKNIVLIGISGSGKTSMGRRLAKRLGREFIDLDSLIQQREGLSIPQIFEERGEDGFRRAETETIKAVSRSRDAVIACGGGVVLKEINMHLLSQNGIIVFMSRPVKDILERVNLQGRPLLRETPEKLYELYNQRLPLYKKYADFEVYNRGYPEKTLRQLSRIANFEKREMQLAVIGDPISHSLSPDIHIPAIQPLLKSLVYERTRVVPEELPGWVTQIRGRGLKGFNVTMPHKEAILPLLDAVDKEAAALGSVNTVVEKGGRLWGYNTDGEGFIKALVQIGEDFKDSSVTILGSGGAAVTIAIKAASKGAKELHLVARNREKAQKICQKIEEMYRTKCHVHPFLEPYGAGNQWKSRIIINTTPLGMHGITEDFPGFDFLDRVEKDALLCDLIYSPARTGFLIEGEKRGLRILGGIHMLIEQALEADRLYLGAELMREKAYNRIIAHLRGKVEGI
ncbi:MAG: shikimate dehydrogenase [Anaerovoracaceae bacterium]